MAGIETGGSVAGLANVDSHYNLQVVTPGRDSTGALVGGGEDNAGAVVVFNENDPGGNNSLGRYVKSPEVDEDYRLRVGLDTVLDRETFNYTAQNTGKHTYTFTTMTATVSAAGLRTNAGAITTTTTGLKFNTFAEFPMIGSHTLWTDQTVAFDQQPTANSTIDFGLFRPGAANPYAPTDGVYFRHSSAGLSAVMNTNGTEVVVALTGFTYTTGTKYNFIIALTESEIEFWIDNERWANIPRPVAAGAAALSASLPWSIRQAFVGAAGAAISAYVTDMNITIGGGQFADSLGAIGNRTLGSYQGLSGGTMGSLASWANNSTPAAAAASNTAALVVGLGGQAQATAQATGAVDNIITSYQVPAGTVAVQGRRLRINGVKVSAANLGAAVATTPTTVALALAFGHTAVSLATAETASFATATTKAPRRVPIGIMYWNTAAPIGATPDGGSEYLALANPVFVNPGEFVAVTAKFITGTATASQGIFFTVTFDYGWE